ncbi:6841_t:CDS:2, partial [Acaulospora colombiana]
RGLTGSQEEGYVGDLGRNPIRRHATPLVPSAGKIVRYLVGSPGPEVPLSKVTRGLRRETQSPFWFPMSSPTSSGEYPPSKRRRMSTNSYPTGTSNQQIIASNMNPNNSLVPGNGQLMSNQANSVIIQQASIPKRGARACTACRKGKNRCEGEVRRANSSSTPASTVNPLPSPPHTVLAGRSPSSGPFSTLPGS